MTNNDSRERKRHNLRVHINHAVGLTLVVMVSLLFFQLLRGYALDIDTGKVVVNGLVLFDSQPEGGEIIVNDEAIDDKTSAKITLVEGQHSLGLKKEGYQTWTRQVEVEASEVVSLENVRIVRDKMNWVPLVESDLQITDVESLSGDNLLVSFNGTSLGLVDLSAESPEIALQEPLLRLSVDDSLLFDGFEVVDDIGQFLLLRMDSLSAAASAPTSYRIYDADQQEFIAGFEAPDSVELRFFGQSQRLLYVNEDNSLVVVDVGSSTAEVIADDVTGYSSSGDAVAVSISEQLEVESVEEEVDLVRQNYLAVIRDEGGTWVSRKFLELGQIPASQLAMFSGQGNEYLAVENGGYTMVYDLDTDPSDFPPEPMFISSIAATNIVDSPSGAFVMISDGSRGAVVDLRGEKLADYSFELTSQVAPYWIDGFHAVQSTGESLTVGDYDMNYRFTVPKLTTEDVMLFVDSDWNNFARMVEDEDGLIELEVFSNR